jgi:hypothetical protein
VQFLIFGLIHGTYLTANQAWRHFHQRKKGVPPDPPKGFLHLALSVGVFLQVSFALIFFRAESLRAALAYAHDLAGHNGLGHIGSVLDGALGFLLFPVVWFLPNTQQILGEEPVGSHASFWPGLRWKPNVVWTLIMAVLFFAILTHMENSSFLYFQF